MRGMQYGSNARVVVVMGQNALTRTPARRPRRKPAAHAASTPHAPPFRESTSCVSGSHRRTTV